MRRKGRKRGIGPYVWYVLFHSFLQPYRSPPTWEWFQLCRWKATILPSLFFFPFFSIAYLVRASTPCRYVPTLSTHLSAYLWVWGFHSALTWLSHSLRAWRLSLCPQFSFASFVKLARTGDVIKGDELRGFFGLGDLESARGSNSHAIDRKGKVPVYCHWHLITRTIFGYKKLSIWEYSICAIYERTYEYFVRIHSAWSQK